MQHQLIPVSSSTVGSQSIPTVNARDLHAFLGVKRQFGDWIKDQVDRARLVENRDYVKITAPPLGEAVGNRGLKIDYHLTLESGKHVAMMSQTDKGFEVRDYFIECERIAKNPAAALSDPSTLRMLLLENVEKVLALESTVSALQPKADIAEQLILADGSVNLTTAAKLLDFPPHKFSKELNQRQWIYKRPGSTHWLAYQPKITSGYVEHKEYLKVMENGDTRAYPQVMITQRGLARLSVVLKSSQLLLEVAA
jgi:anti-repressor protein